MTSNQRSPLWPYMLVLGGLFALSLAIPHGWQADAQSNRFENWQSADRSQSIGRKKLALPAVSILRPAPESTPELTTLAPLTMAAVATQQSTLTQPFPETSVPGEFAASSLVERVSQKISDLRRFVSSQALVPLSGKISERVPREAKMVPDDGFAPIPDDAPEVSNTASEAPESQNPSRSQSIPDSYNCPVPRSLLAQLTQVSQNSECASWAASVRDLCLELCQTSPGDNQAAVEIVRKLELLVPQAERLAAQLQNSQAAENLRRARYALERRLFVWSVIFTDERRSVFANVRAGDEQRRRLSQAVTAAGSYLQTISYGDGWRKYLLLDDVARLTDASQGLSQDETVVLARTVLGRVAPPQVSDAQRQVLGNAALTALADQLHTWATAKVDLREVLAALEQYEGSGLTCDGRKFVALAKQLNWSPEESDRKLAGVLDMHYRNANLRVTLTPELLNRLTPETPPSSGIVNDTILNARVNGSSETKAQLQFKLVPDTSRLHFLVTAEGMVDSITQATRGPATFNSRGEANFVVRKTVTFDREGWSTDNASAAANSNSQLTGVQTTLDGKPVLGSIARRRATSKEEALRGEARQEVNRKVADSAEDRLNNEVERRLKLVDEATREQLLAPLAKLGLEAEPITLETSAQRLTIRLRLASPNQPAGHTARPQAPSDSLLGVQANESAIDNVLDQLQLAGQTMSLGELFDHLAERTSQPMLAAPSDLPRDAVITFSQDDPIRIRFVNGTVRLTLMIDELRGSARQWRDFTVSTTYRPQIDGLHVRLVRAGPIELGGAAKGQSEVTLRGIFSKMLPPERKLELIPALVADHPQLADLTVNQCAIEDGWIGLAIGPARDESNDTTAGRSVTNR